MSGIAVVVSVLIAAQVGYVSHREKQRSASLEKQLEDLERSTRDSAEDLARRLQHAVADAGRMRDALDSAQDEATLLADKLGQVNARAALLEALAEEAPPLELKLAPLEGLEGLVVWARNPGARPVQISGAEGSVWLDGQPSGLGRSSESVTLAPDDDVEFFEYTLLGDEPYRVANGSSTFRGALCFTIERSMGDLSTPWVAQYWFEYRPELGVVGILERERWPLESDGQGCDLAAAAPPW